jgi:hypothetical protein
MALVRENEHTVSGGPSKFDLMLSLFDLSTDHPLRFEGGKPGTVSWCNWVVRIKSVELLKASSESWALAGATKDGKKVRLIYSTQSRAGMISFPRE